jgi:uncharacterized iron-regulated membrane protein
MSIWRRWLRQPQHIWLRRALFQVHLWTGVALGLYIFMISITGSVLVYRNEIFAVVTPAPIIAISSGERLSDEQLKDAAVRLYPGHIVSNIIRARNPDQAVEVTLERDGTELERLFDPYTGADLGQAVAFGITLAFGLLDLHDNLMAGPTGRMVNGFGAVGLVILCATGAVIWWPGARQWRRSIWPDWRTSWKRINWSLHSAFGFWFLPIIVVWGITGAYLCFPAWFIEWADTIQPMTDENAGARGVDTVMYWLAYLHFGRFGGRLPGCGPVCNETLKAVWATLGLLPPAMFVTGAIMWWNRVLRPRYQPSTISSPPSIRAES